MKKLILIFLLFSLVCSAQSNEKEQVKSAINQFFDGFKKADSALVKNAFTKTVVLQTITKTGEVKNEDLTAFARQIAQMKPSDLDERISFSEILIDGNLASVWMPYEFYFQGKFSHCGVNSFQLVKVNDLWKIQYIIDTRRTENCNKK